MSDACMSDTEHKSVKNSFHHLLMDVLTPSPHVVYRAKMSLHVRVRLPTFRTDCFGRASDKISHVGVDELRCCRRVLRHLLSAPSAATDLGADRLRSRPTSAQTDSGPLLESGRLRPGQKVTDSGPDRLRHNGGPKKKEHKEKKSKRKKNANKRPVGTINTCQCPACCC